MSTRTLYQTLLDSDIARLRVIAHRWGVTLVAERRTDVAAELADAMARTEAVEHALTLLQDNERAALDDLLRHQGALPWAVFVRRWGEVRPVGPGRLEREELWRDPVSAAEGLWYTGLVQRAFEARPSGQVEVAFVPEELRLYMPEPLPLEIVLPEPVTPPAHQIVGADALADDLVTLLAALHVTPFRSPPDDVRAAILSQMRPSAIGEPIDLRLALLETLALEQGWVQRDEEGALRPVPEPMLAWLQADVWEQWSSLARAWMESTGWNDLAAVPTLRPDPARGWPNEPLSARRAFLDVLRHCQPGVWYVVADFVAFVREHAMDFLRPDGDYDVWALRNAESKAPLRGVEAWDAVEGALVTHLLTGPLCWLGVVDVGGAAPSLPVVAFRLSAAGAAILGFGDSPDVLEPPSLRLGDDGVVWVPVRRRYARFQLRRIAQPLGWADGYRYRLTPSSLALARRQRISVQRIVRFLTEQTGRAVPSSLRTAIEAAYGEQGAARLEHVWLLRVPDPTVLEHSAVRPFVREQLVSGVVIIREADREKVLAALARSGILPDVSPL